MAPACRAAATCPTCARMIAWLLTFLALLGVGWVPVTTEDLNRSGCSAPSRGPQHRAGEQPGSAATTRQRRAVATRCEYGGALQHRLLDFLSWRPSAARTFRVAHTQCHARHEQGRAAPSRRSSRSKDASGWASMKLEHGPSGLHTPATALAWRAAARDQRQQRHPMRGGHQLRPIHEP